MSTRPKATYGRVVDSARDGRVKHGSTYTKEWGIWSKMRNRCESKKCREYKFYGARGIKVCERWHDFAPFLSDMGKKPNGLSLDRIDNDGPYSPHNCRWATPKQQARNSRSCRYIIINGVRKCVSEWAELYPVKAATIVGRLALGWPEELAVTAPHGHRRIWDAA